MNASCKYIHFYMHAEEICLNNLKCFINNFMLNRNINNFKDRIERNCASRNVLPMVTYSDIGTM